jgi:hypothetical protein
LIQATESNLKKGYEEHPARLVVVRCKGEQVTHIYTLH